jgi:sigma-E factor negative regulatory protein RseA
MNRNSMPRHSEPADLREQLSSLIDGELDAADRARCLDRLCRDEAASTEWAAWHLVGDALRSSDVAALHAPGFVSDLAHRLADEPTILAPPVRGSRVRLIRRFAMPGAAAAAAVAVLAVVALPMLREAEPGRVEVARVQGASQPAGPMIPVVASVSQAAVPPLLRRPSPVDGERFDVYLSAHGQMSGPIGMPRTSQYLRQGGIDAAPRR